MGSPGDRVSETRRPATDQVLSGDVFEFTWPAEGQPFEDVKIAPGIEAECMRSRKKGRIGLIVLFGRLAVRFPAIAEVGDEFVVLVEDADAAVQFRHENFVFVLVEAARSAHIAGDGALVFEFQ